MEGNSSPKNKCNGLSLRTRMLVLSLVSFLAIFIVIAMGAVLLNTVKINGPTYKKIRVSKDALEKIALLKSDIYQLSGEIHQYISEVDKVASENLLARIKDHADDIDFKYEDLNNMIDSKERKENIVKSEAIWGEYKETLLKEIIPAIQRGDRTRAMALASGIQEQRFSSFSATIALMVDVLRREVYSVEKNVSDTIRSKIMVTSVVTFFLVLAIAVISVVISESVTRPIRRCVDFAKRVAAGDLHGRLEIKACGEVAELSFAMNTMAENLHGIVSRIHGASDELTKIDENIEKAARQVLGSSKIQEESVVETSKTVEEINASVLDISQGVDRLANSAAETSSSILEMAASIEQVAGNTDKLAEEVDEVSSSVIEMVASIKGISSNIVNLLDASTTTASSVAEMDATIRQVEKNAMDTAAISETVKADAATGLRTVQETISGMQEIRQAAHLTSEVVEHLSLRANDIGAILSVIDEVAEQTNLLALNAAIIAAQAGEHGKGFAVVADEIKELAERTSSSTREIALVIKGVQEDTGRAVASINQAELAICAGEQLSERSGEALEKIVQGVRQAGLQIDAIAKATIEQARGSNSIRVAMEQVEEMVEQIASSTREQAKGTDLITNAVEHMREMTSQVRSSTREQSRASALIARATEDVSAMIDQIRESCKSQTEHSKTIDNMVDNISASSNATLQAAKVMDSAVAGLSRQIDLLEKEMSGFSV